MPKPSIVLIDDSHSILKMYEKILSYPGWEIKKAVSGESGLELISKTDNIALVILDINMPDITGLEVVERLKSNLQTEEIPVLFLSSDSGRKSEAYKLGASDFLVKPFDFEILKEKVVRYYRHFQKMEEIRELKRQLELELDTTTEKYKTLSNAVENLLKETKKNRRPPQE